MLIQAIGVGLPAALAVALSPLPIIGIVLILSGNHGGRNGALFAAGWIAGVTLVSTIAWVAFSGADEPDSTSAALADWLRVFAGAALIAFGVRKWLSRPRVGDDIEVPAWMETLQDAGPGHALRLGGLLAGANPKNFVLAASATAAMIETGAHGTDLAIAAGAFILLCSSTVIGAVVLHAVGGRQAAAFLEAVREYMVAHSATIMVIILVILGANVLGGGLYGLGR